MDSFLFIGDYAKQIQADNLSQLIGGDSSILESIQSAAIEECRSYLESKYDTTDALRPITPHDSSKTYKAGQTVYLSPTAGSYAQTVGSFQYTADGTETVVYDPKLVNSSIVEIIRGVTPLLSSEYAFDSEAGTITFPEYLIEGEALTIIYTNAEIVSAPIYNPASTYAKYDITIKDGDVLQANDNILTPEAFNASHWSKIGTQYQTFYAAYPAEKFEEFTYYSIGKRIFYQDRIYIALRPTPTFTHDDKLQINISGTPTFRNIYPDDTEKGLLYWGAGEAYSIPANTEITDTDYWTPGDNRNQKLLQICIDVTLYHANARVSSKNIPDMRLIRYMGHGEDRETRGQRVLYPTYCALGWLQAAVIGEDIMPGLPVKQPVQGRRIRFGGNQKNVNSY